MPKAGGSQRVVKEMITGSLFLSFSFLPPCPPFSIPFTFASSPLSESLEQATVWPHAQFCWKNIWKNIPYEGHFRQVSRAKKIHTALLGNAAMTVITMKCLLTELGPAKWENFGPSSGHKDLEPNTFLSSPLTKSKSTYFLTHWERTNQGKGRRKTSGGGNGQRCYMENKNWTPKEEQPGHSSCSIWLLKETIPEQTTK